MRHRLDAGEPHLLVQRGVDDDIVGAHGLLGKQLDLLDGFGGALLEGGAKHALVQVDGVLARDDLVHFTRKGFESWGYFVGLGLGLRARDL